VWREKLSRYVYRYAPSESHGPFPTALLLHGCAGDKDHLAGWGRLLARHGLLVYTIDSLSPRNISSLQARCLVCTGLMLQGKERSRDLTESISIALQDPMVDPRRINLIGWSHGAWTILEWMLDDAAMVCANHPDVAVKSLILNYPYCGLASAIHEKEWPHLIPVMMVTGGRDNVVPNKKANAFAERLSRQKVSVTRIHIASAGHAFDVEGRSQYNQQATKQLRKSILEFLHSVNCLS
jgi:dienelactone hydrolase